MAFQAGGAHALDRALEAIAYAWTEMTRTPATAVWEKPGREPTPRRCGWRRPSPPCRAGSRWWSAATPSRPGTAGPGSSPRWSPATRSWSSRTPARCCRWRSPCRCARRCSRRPGHDPHLVTLAAEDPADKLAARPRGAPGGPADRLHRRQRVRRVAGGQRPAGGRVHREGRRQHRRDRLDRRLRGDVPATWPSRSRCTPARCAPRPRTSTSRRAASRPTRARKSPAEVAAGIGAALDKLLGDDARAVELLGGVVNPGVVERLEAAPGQGRGAGRVPRGHPPGVPRRDGAHAHPGGPHRGRRRRSTSPSASGRWPS